MSQKKDTTKREIQKELIDKIINKYPQLEKDKKDIIKEIIGHSEDNTSVSEEVVFDRMEIEGNVLYRDSAGGLWNKDANLVGTTLKTDNIVKLYLFGNSTDDEKDTGKVYTIGSVDDKK